MKYADKLKYAREKMFLSQEALAEELKVAGNTVNRWENGKNEPNYKSRKAFYLFCEQNDIKFDD